MLPHQHHPWGALLIARHKQPARRSKQRAAVLLAVAASLCGASLFRIPLAASTTATVLDLPAQIGTVIGVSDDQTWIGYTDNSGRLHRFNRVTGEDNSIASVANGMPSMTADGQTLLFSAWQDPTLSNYGVYQWHAGQTPEASGDYVRVSPDDDSLANYPSMSADGSIVAWSGYPGTYVRDLTTGTTRTLDAFRYSFTAVSPDGTLATVSGYQDDGASQVAQFDSHTGSRTRRITGRQFQITSLSADGRYGAGVAYGYVADSGITLIDFATQEVRVIPHTYDGQCTGNPSLPFVSLAADGQTMAFASPSSGGQPSGTPDGRGYFVYDAASQNVTDVSGTYASTSGNCPSVFLTANGSDVYFTSDYSAPAMAMGLVGMQPAFAAGGNNLYRSHRSTSGDTDADPPVLSGPASVVADAVTPSGATVTFAVTARDAVDGVVPTSCSPSSGSGFAIGVTAVVCTARDLSGNPGSLQMSVTVLSASQQLDRLVTYVRATGDSALTKLAVSAQKSLAGGKVRKAKVQLRELSLAANGHEAAKKITRAQNDYIQTSVSRILAVLRN